MPSAELKMVLLGLRHKECAYHSNEAIMIDGRSVFYRWTGMNSSVSLSVFSAGGSIQGIGSPALWSPDTRSLNAATIVAMASRWLWAVA